jgi:hypothetical protein
MGFRGRSSLDKRSRCSVVRRSRPGEDDGRVRLKPARAADRDGYRGQCRDACRIAG